ncbi:pectinesterase family protein [Paenibacillus rigui]|nr:pectinesterase family protein [Paenibacillus rigui]
MIFLIIVSYLPGLPQYVMADALHASASSTAAPIYPPTELRMSPASNTDNSVVLVWEKPMLYSNVTNYNIYDSEGRFIGKTPKTYFKIEGLSSETAYRYTIRAQDASGMESLDSNSVQITTKPVGVRLNVKDFGATGNGQSLDTAAIQAAMDACPPGGTVYFPAGSYLTGALFFNHSHMTVYVDAGAQIKPSRHKADFLPFVAARHSLEEPKAYASVFNAGVMDHTNYGFSITDIAMIGPGTIGDEDNGLALREEYDQDQAEVGVTYGGGSLLSFNNARNIYLDGLQIRNGMMWTVVPVYSKDITAYGLDIVTTVHNGDGFDPNSSENVYILSSTFQTGDDSSAIKSGINQEGREIGRPSRFIYYRGDTFSGGHGGIVLGSEMSGGVSDVFAEDCILTPVDVPTNGINAGFKIKTSTSRGGYIRNVQIRDSLINRIELNSNYDKLTVPDNYPPDLSNFRFINLRNSDTNGSGNVISLTGAASTPTSDNSLKNVQFSNCSFYQAQLAYTENIYFNNCTFTQPISVTNSNNIVQDGSVLYDKSFPIREDFTSYRTGDLPGGYWTAATDIPGALKIAADGSQEANSLYFDDTGSGYVQASRKFTAQTGVVTAQVYMMLPAPPNLTNGVPNGTYATKATSNHNLFQLLGSDGKMALSITTQGNGSLGYNIKNVTAPAIVPSIPLGSWFSVKAVIDYPNKSVDVYYNGTKVLSGQPFYDATSIPKDIGTFKTITPNNNTTVAAQVYLDDLMIEGTSASNQGYGINLTSLTGANSISAKGGSLQFSAAKTTGSSSSVAWAVYQSDLTPTDAAIIDSNGVLTARKNGNVVVTASMNDGTAVVGLMPITITGQQSMTGFKPVSVTTAVGTPPELPSVVSVCWDDGSVTPASVTWDLVIPAQYKQTGPLTVQGTVEGFSQRAAAKVNVVPLTVSGYKPVVIKTTPGTAPSLPEKVTALLNNKTTQTLPVVWSGVSPDQYAGVNVKGFTVAGTVQGASLPVTAHVSVLPASMQGLNPILVAADGSGDYKTIQEAVQAVPDANASRAVIFIKNGIYYEKVLIPETKPYVSFIGESEDGTILTYDDHPKKTAPDGTPLGLGTYNDYTLMIKGHDFNAKHMTIANTSGSGAGQSVAVDVYADKAFFEKCKILGYQDTLLTRNLTDNADPANYANNSTVQTYRSYYKDCYIAGSVDFIFGPGIAVFDHSEIHSMLSGHVTAASTPAGQKYGYVFLDSMVTGEALLATKQTAIGPVDLGRPWRPYAQTVYLNSYMDKHIATGGWNNFGKASNEATAYYAEYQSTGPGANPTGRLSWTHQLTDDQAKKYTIDQIFAAGSLIGGTDSWDPTIPSPAVAIASIPAIQVMTLAGSAPVLPTVVDAVYTDGTTQKVQVTWEPVAPEQYAQDGTFTVKGTVQGTSIQAAATITVRAGSLLTGPDSVTAGQPLDILYGWAGVSEEVYGMDLTFSYNPDQMQFVSADSLVNGVSVVAQTNGSGQARILVASSTTGVYLTGSLSNILQLHFKTNISASPATSTVSLTNAMIADGSGSETAVEGSSYQVVIKAAAAANTTVLVSKINEAQSKLASASAGTKWGQYAQAAVDALNTAVSKAANLLNSSYPTQAEVDQAVVDLSLAIEAFNDSLNMKASVGDLAIIASHYGMTSADTNWATVQRYDINHDLKLDIVDLAAIAKKIVNE